MSHADPREGDIDESPKGAKIVQGVSPGQIRPGNRPREVRDFVITSGYRDRLPAALTSSLCCDSQHDARYL